MVNSMKPLQVGLLGAGPIITRKKPVLQRNQLAIERRTGRQIKISMYA